MTRMEMVIVVIAALIPIISLVILFSFNKKKKKKPQEAKVVESPTKQKEEPAPKPDTPPVSGGISTASLDSSEFLGYLQEKSEQVKKPERNEYDVNLGEVDEDLFSDIDFSKMRKKVKKKTVAQEIYDLSPELKAMILTGVLDRKEF